MNLPPYGFCCAVRPRHVDSADRVIVQPIGCNETWTIQLIGSWPPPLDTPAGRLAADFCRSILEEAGSDLSVWIPSPVAILRRAPDTPMAGHIFVGTDNSLATMLHYAGHSSASNPVLKSRKFDPEAS